jgi:hypothetical protein
MLERGEQLRVQASQASEVFGVYLVGLLLVGVDEPKLPGIGHKYLVTTALEHSANPGRMRASLDGYAHGPL